LALFGSLALCRFGFLTLSLFGFLTLWYVCLLDHKLWISHSLALYPLSWAVWFVLIS
jgi:hypothetical protein